MPLRCLIVDDNEDFLASARRLLAAQGLEVVGCARSGIEAVRLAEALEPDIALVDLQLGEEDGLEVTRRLAVGASTIRVIVISTHGEDDLRDLVADSPAVGFLAKTDLGADAIVKLLG